MGENLNIALQLTGIGMGMTFLAIGALVLGMYAMTLLFKERTAKEEPVVEDPALDHAQVPWLVSDNNAKERAAAAAVAVALAQTKGKQRAAAAAVAVALAQQQDHSAAVPVQVGNWNSNIRSHQVSHRDRFAAQRRMQTK